MSDDRSSGLEEQERDEILQEIDKLVADNRLPVSEDLEKLKPKKSGIGFPLMINLFAVAAVISTFYFSNRLFEQKQETLNNENITYQSAEGKLLEELKRESAAKLEQKEQEIGAIQTELAELDRQSRELVATMDQQIADRETELRKALEAELEEERRKLQSQGKSETDIEDQLRRIEEQRTAEYQAELNRFRTETEQAIAAKEQELAKARQLNQELLADANSEISKIQEETNRRESELTARFESEKKALAAEAAAAEAQLEQLAADQAREELIIDQINGSYETILDMMNSGRSDEALNQIAALKELINDPGLSGLKAVTDRAANDRKLLDLLRERIEEQSYKEDVDTSSLTAAADLLMSAREIAALGDDAYKAGNFDAAEQYYKRSLEKIPALSRAWTGIESIAAAKESAQVSSLLDSAAALAESGSPGQAAEQYAKAASAAVTHNPELLAKAVGGILTSADTARSTQIAARDSAITELQNKSSAEADQLKKQLSEKDAALKALQQSSGTEINTLKTRLSRAESDYKSSIAGLNAEWEQKAASANDAYEAKIAELSASNTAQQSELSDTNEAQLAEQAAAYEAEIAALKTEYEAKIAEAESAYSSQLNNADSSLSALEGEKNDEIDRLTRLIGERDQQNLRLNSEKEDAAAALAEAEKTITEGETYIEELQTEVQQAEQTQKELEGRIEELTAQLEETKASLNAEIDSLKSRTAAPADAAAVAGNTELEKTIREAESEIDRLTSELASAEKDLADLETKYKNQLEVMSSKLRSSEVTGYNNGVQQGRFDALEDILLFTSYLEGTATAESNAETTVTKLALSEPKYSEAVSKIQELATEGISDSASTAVVARDILIGSITYVSGNSVVIEPLTDMTVEDGTRITINRRERGQGETYITFGIVTAADENKISARTDPAGTEPPKSGDLVYITR